MSAAIQRAAFLQAAIFRPARSTGARKLPAPYARPRAQPLVVRAGILDFLNEGKKQFTINQAGEYDSAAVRQKIEKLIAEEKVLVFSWTGCPYCKKAKALLDEVGAKYTAVELDLMGEEGKQIRAELAKLTGRTSVPNIWIAQKNVGGCNDGPGVVTLNNNGELKPLLQAAGAL